jgi:hypothetical protein
VLIWIERIDTTDAGTGNGELHPPGWDGVTVGLENCIVTGHRLLSPNDGAGWRIAAGVEAVVQLRSAIGRIVQLMTGWGWYRVISWVRLLGCFDNRQALDRLVLYR